MRPIIKSLLLILSVAVPSGISASIRHTVSFDRSALELTTDTLNGAEYIVPLYKGLSNAAEPGYPELPYKVLSFSVPYNAVDFTVSQVDADGERIALSRPIRHAQNPEIAERNYMAEYIGPKAEVYSSNSGFPELTVTYSGEGYDAGINKYVSVMVSPVIYLPGENVLVFNNSVTFVIDWRITDDFSGYPVQPVMPRRYSDVEESLQQMAEYVENPASLRKNAVASSRFRVADNNPEYEYIIVTAREFGDAFQRLIAMRRMRGYSSKLFYIEDIVSDPKYADGDVVSGINDDAGKLRAFLTDAYTNHGTRFVLLGGKPPYMPIRYAISEYIKDAKEDKLEEAHIPTDHYFGDLNTKWKIDTVKADYKPLFKYDFNQEIGVGRLLCKTTDDINNYIDKLLIYEHDPGVGNPNYLLNGMIYTSYTLREYYTSCNSYIKECYPNLRMLEQSGGISTKDLYAYGADLIDDMNKNMYGFWCIQGHGHPGGISLTDTTPEEPKIPPYGINAVDAAKAHLTEEQGNGLDCLKNKNFPSWTYSSSCTLMPFDNYMSDNTPMNMGESFINGKNYGGVAFLGNTRVSFSRTSNEMGLSFFQYLKTRYKYIFKRSEISKVHAFSKSYVSKSLTLFYINHNLLAHNLLGDPILEIWESIPTRADALIKNQSIIPGKTSFVSVSITDNNHSTRFDFDNEAITESTNECNMLYSVYGNKILPYIYPLYIQNIDINLANYIIANEVFIGNAVNGLKNCGDVNFNEKSDFTIKALGDVSIENGVNFKSGSKVKIISDGSVLLKNIEMDAGSLLIIEAKNLKIGKDVIINKGAKFQFNLKK